MNLKNIIIAATAVTCLTASAALAESSDKTKKDLEMNSGANAGASSGEQGKTSDRTPGKADPQRTEGSTKSGAAGTDAAQTPEGTSDRSPNKNQ